MRKVAYLFGACCSILLLQSEVRADVGSAVGLREMLHNCETNAITADERIKACTILLKSNLADRKMEGFLYALIGQAHTQTGDLDAARADYAKALERFPDYVPALINHGALEEKAGSYDVALADFDKAISVDPTNALAWRNRCETRLDAKQDPNAALSDCNEALRLDPKNPHAFMKRHDVYTRLGRCAEAAADFEAAVRIDPSLAKAASDAPSCHSNQAAGR